MKLKKTAIATSVMALALVTSFAGAISGTIAWYASSTRVTVSYQGTSVSQSEQLQIGLESTVDLTDLTDYSEYGLTKEDGTNYYWAKAGSGLKANAINGYLKKNNYATNELSPVTSLGYAAGDALSLKKAPMAYSTTTYDASRLAYSRINFIFRVIRNGASGEEYAANEPIWITDAQADVQSSADKPIYQALRVHFQGSAIDTNVMTNRYILNPSSQENSGGSTPVAGVLDLNKDGYYDYVDGQEILYGSYAGSAPSESWTAFSGDTAYDDVNKVYPGVSPLTDDHASTFLAKHHDGMKGYTKENFASWIKPSLASYESLLSVSPLDPGNGHLTGGKPVCYTKVDDDKVAHAIATIYLEGWDHSVIDAAINSKFNLGLQFQINRAG